MRLFATGADGSGWERFRSVALRRRRRWHAYREGLEPREVEPFARAWGLVAARPAELSVAEIRRLLESYGPLWVGEASPGLHEAGGKGPSYAPLQAVQ